MKKNYFWNRLSTAVLACAALVLGACVDDDDDKGMPHLEVSPETLVFAADGTPQGADAFTVRSNRPWTLEITEGGDWVTPSVKKGDGNGKVHFTVPASNTGRVAKLSFSLRNSYGAYLTREVTIEQGEAPRAGEVSALVAYIKSTWPSLESGTEELGYAKKSIPAVILANNEGGNNFGKLYVGDNITLPNSAIILYSTSEFTRENSAKYPVGRKVTLDLSNAKYAPYGNLRELKDVVVTLSDDEPVEVAVPSISAATLNGGEYQGQYVRVNDLKPQADFIGQAWAEAAKRVVRFDASDGEAVQSYMATAADAPAFADITIADRTGALYGTAEQNYRNIQLIPTRVQDVAAFVVTGPSLAVNPAAELVLASESGAKADLTVTSNVAWTTKTTGAGFTIAPATGANDATVTVTATAANATAATAELGTVTFEGEGVESVTVRIVQAARPSDQPKSVADFMAFVRTLAPEANAEASLAEWTGQRVEGYIAANDAGGNLYQMLSVVDNTGEPGSGVLLSDAAYEEVGKYPVGARVIWTVGSASTVYNSYGLYKINGVAVEVSDAAPVEMHTPTISLAQFLSNDYMGMNVTVSGLSYKGEAGRTWYDGTANYATQLFTDGTSELTARIYKSVAWGGEIISPLVANAALTGVAQIYNGTPQLFPQTADDVAAFRLGATEPLITAIEPASLSWSAEDTASKQIEITVVNLGTHALSVDQQAIAPFRATIDGTKITLAPSAANTTSEDIVCTLTVSVEGGNSRQVTLTQYAAGSVGDTKGVYTSMSQFIPDAINTSNRYYPSASTIDGKPATGFKLGTSSLAGVFTSAQLGAGVAAEQKLSFYAVAWTGKSATVYIRVDNGGSVVGTAQCTIKGSAGATGSGNDFTFTDIGDSDYYTFRLTGLTPQSTVTISTSPDFAATADRDTGRAILLGVQLY